MVEPTASVDVVKLAFPALSCAVPSTLLPMAKVTGPFGITVGDVIVAVNVTTCPNVEGFGEEVSVAELVAWVITWITTGELLLRLFTSPPYIAVRG